MVDDDVHDEDDFWERAEEEAQKIISVIEPTDESKHSRRRVIDYIRSLITDGLGFEVFLFGSVPLETYLPHGDIDLAAFGCLDVEDNLVNSVLNVLNKEHRSRAASFVIKEVNLVRAKVKVVRCLIPNFVVVEISFNQLGGVCTLCFLEKVDRLIGRDHLFKHSVILIKAWCYYESRTLGASHSLISTYALETMILYILNRFHSSLGGPLAVLYTFLDYFGEFDWDNYGISLRGPFRISSLPEIEVETPENGGGGGLLLGDEFLRDCLKLFSVPPRVSKAAPLAFQSMHLNIVDPLNDNNNLGRSVNKANFIRIRSAFKRGAQELGRILSGSKESLAAEIANFFLNTLSWHGKGEIPDNCRTDLASPLSENDEESDAVPDDSANQKDASEE